ncbi:MAG: MBL fold metallo-hydrolase, partial [Candidatus Aminicenantes bacterium]|nr:MBL fold metallo-hydrolase [Candidatus Aminicenantes bacterium]
MKKIIILLLCLSLCGLAAPLFGAGNLKIYFLDVGQGDCTLIVTPNNKAVLIDCNASYQSRPISVLNNLSLSYSDYIIATHN